MVNNYLKVKFVSFDVIGEVPTNVDVVELIIKKDKVNEFGSQKSIDDGIDKAFAKN